MKPRNLLDFDWETIEFRGVREPFVVRACLAMRRRPMRKILVAVFLVCLDCSTGLRTPNYF